MAIWVFGHRPGGRVEDCEGTYVRSWFVHAQGLPFKFVRSELVVGDEVVEIPPHAASVLAGYARTWFAVLAASVAVYSSYGDVPRGMAILLWIGVVAFAALWALSFRIGRLNQDEIARRRVFRSVTGVAADPALLAHATPELADRLRAELADRAKQLSPDSYRDALADWRAIAMHTGSADARYLGVALTLARLERDEDLVSAIWSRVQRFQS